jgi:hypothetical protein
VIECYKSCKESSVPFYFIFMNKNLAFHSRTKNIQLRGIFTCSLLDRECYHLRRFMEAKSSRHIKEFALLVMLWRCVEFGTMIRSISKWEIDGLYGARSYVELARGLQANAQKLHLTYAKRHKLH